MTAFLTIVGLLVGAALSIAAPVLLVMHVENVRMRGGMEAVRDALGVGSLTTWKYARWRLPILDATVDGAVVRVLVEPTRDAAHQAVGPGVPMKLGALGMHLTVRPPASRAAAAEAAVAGAERLRWHEGAIEGWSDPPKGARSRQRAIELVREALGHAAA